VITRFFNNEPKYLEPMLDALLGARSDLIWQERYIILLWLSHLVLTPFDLKSISSSYDNSYHDVEVPQELRPESLPRLVTDLLFAGLDNLGAPSKEREAASRMLVLIALRPDMQRLGLLDRLVTLMFVKVSQYTQDPAASMYECLGFLSVLFGIIKTGSADDVASCLTSIFEFGLKVATGESEGDTLIRASAPARKMLIGTLRTSTLHAISLKSKSDDQVVTDEKYYARLENTIQYFLDVLGDKDTPVRLAGSKAFSILAQRLDEDMKEEVVLAILDSLEEDILYEDADSGRSVPVTLLTIAKGQNVVRNLTAVNPLKWQGLLLTLGHLLFRRTAPLKLLPAILRSLASGLDFEQRSATGTSVGGAVRDAACFGFWSLARKYATTEVQAVDLDSIKLDFNAVFSSNEQTSTLQLVAEQLVVSACLDPSGNIRRGASAALQELIGRHPDIIIDGIALVQIVDYHAVARRSHAILDVAVKAAELAESYRLTLLNALLGWRGIRAVDDTSRRDSALTISKLSSTEYSGDQVNLLNMAEKQLSKLPVENSKTLAERRHGLLLTMSCVLRTVASPPYVSSNSANHGQVGEIVRRLWEGIKWDSPLLGSLKGRFVPDIILEAAGSLMSSIAPLIPDEILKSPYQAVQVLDLCLTKADQEIALAALAEAAFVLFSRLSVSRRLDMVSSWLEPTNRKLPAFSCRGRILALGAVYATLPADERMNNVAKTEGCRNRLFAQLADFIRGDWPIETKAMALRSLVVIIPYLAEEDPRESMSVALDDYTNDQRGDVGSLVRTTAVHAVSAIVRKSKESPNDKVGRKYMQVLIEKVFRLAGEKLDKLRFEAWKCIEGYLKSNGVHPAES
jgi:tubulin-specific chaperone D